jgi:hypothetical protein
MRFPSHDLSNNPNPPFAESQFLNELTVPAQGEILLLIPPIISNSTPFTPAFPPGPAG